MTTFRARWRLVAVAIVALAAVAVIISLTVWNASESGASNPTASDTERAMLDFAQCMRDNGVPSFPDPVARADGSFGFDGRPPGVPLSVLDDALERCQSELQATGSTLGPGLSAQDPESQDALLGFSRCMRENGVPEFPDPTPSGGFHGLFDGIDPDAPRVQQALQSCQSFLGQIFGHGGGS